MENLRREKMDWVRGSSIGRGCYGTVHMAVDKSDGRIFAVKSVDLVSCLEAQSVALETEIKILKSISSPWVVEYLSDDITAENGASFRNLHMEYMPGGTASDVAKDERVLRSRIHCIVSGLRDVHSASIVHCDVKGRNILIGSSPGAAKLADFGSAYFAAQSSTDQLVPRGSPLWMAPEVVRGEYQGPESDVWSLGCTIIEMVTGRTAWEDFGPKTLLRIGYSDEIPELPAQLSELGKDFVDKCLRRDHTERWSCDQLLRHPFVSSSKPITHTTPRCVLDFIQFSDNDEENYHFSLEFESLRGRIGELASDSGAIWESDGWIEVRDVRSNKTEVGTSSEYSDNSGVKLEIPNCGFEVCNCGDCADVAAVVSGDHRPADFSWMHGHVDFTAGENILFVNLLIFTAITCSSIWFTIIKMLQKLFLFDISIGAIGQVI